MTKQSTQAIARIPRGVREQRTQVVRTSQKLILDVKAGGNFYGGLNFKLSDLAGYTTLTLYDMYRIDRIEVTICPILTTNVVKGTLGADFLGIPILSTCIDHDDSSTPGTLSVVLSNPTCVVHGPLDRTITRSFTPMIAMSAYQGAFTGYTAEQPQWLDASTPDVQHYALKYAVENAIATTSSQLIVFYAKMWVSLRYPVN